MKNKAKLLVTLLMSVLMVFCAFGLTAFAGDEVGSGGTAADAGVTHNWQIKEKPTYAPGEPDASFAFRCKDSDCEFNDWSRVSLVAEDAVYSGKDYDCDSLVCFKGNGVIGADAGNRPDGLTFSALAFYKVEGETETAINGKPLNAGEYIVETEATLDGTEVTLRDSFEIAQREVFVVPEAAGKKYGDSDPEEFAFRLADENGEDVENIEWQGALSREEGEDVGTYEFDLGTLEPLNSNFEFILNVQNKFVISKATAASVSIGNWQHGADPSDIKVCVGEFLLDEKDYTYEFWTNNGGSETKLDDTPVMPGKYRVLVKVAGTDNYDALSCTADFEVLNGTARFSVLPEPAVLEYNGKEQELLDPAGASSDGILKYAVKKNPHSIVWSRDYSEKVPKAKAAGTYYVFFLIEGEGGYGDTYYGPLPVTIARQNEANLGVLALGISPDFADIFADMDFENKTIFEIIMDLTINHGFIPGSSSYGDPAALLIMVNGKVYTPLNGLVHVTYRGTTEDDEEIEGNFIPMVTKLPAGSYSLEVTLGPTLNHKAAKANAFLAVEPAVPEFIKTPLPVEDLEYNGTYQSVLTKGTCTEGGTIFYSRDGESNWTTVSPRFKDPGTYKVYMMIRADNSNYADSEIIERTVTIGGTKPVDPTDDPAVDPEDPTDVDPVIDPDDPADSGDDQADEPEEPAGPSDEEIAAATPAKVKLTKVVRAKKSATVKFKKLSKNTVRYEIKITNKKTGSSVSKIVNQKSKKTISVKVKSLRRKTAYTVKVRAINYVYDRYVYGPWSNAKSFKTK